MQNAHLCLEGRSKAWGWGGGRDGWEPTLSACSIYCRHYSELVTEIFKETDFKCKLKGKCSQTGFLLLCSYWLLRLYRSPALLVVSIESHILSHRLPCDIPDF